MELAKVAPDPQRVGGSIDPGPAGDASAFLKMTSGSTSIAMTPNSQTTSVAITQVEKPVICSPSVSHVVTSSPTKVVTSAIPPVIARTYLNDSLKISGARMNRRHGEDHDHPSRNPDAGVMTNPGSSHLATSSPMAFATSSTTVLARSTGPSRTSSRCAATLRRRRRAGQAAAGGRAAAPSDRSHAMIRNPILKGFNPDPSICRVGNDYYIATSTFEWYPGVQIHHSRDLVNWRLVTRPLDRAAPARHARRARQLRRLGPLPLLRRRPASG